MIRPWVSILLVTFALSAQEPPIDPRGRGGRGTTREFLGLGAAPDPVAAARGEKVFSASCAICHGPKAGGGTGSNLVRSELVLHDEKGELIGPVLMKGRPDQGMPAFPSLAKEQVADIAQFLHMRVEQVANRGIYQRANLVTGDAKKGEEYFNGAGRCNTCHSPAGDLAHIATKFRQPDQLQNRFLYPAGRTRRAKVTMPNGETMEGVIKKFDDFNISIRDNDGGYHQWDRATVKVEVPDPLAVHKELLAKYSDTDMHNITAYLWSLK